MTHIGGLIGQDAIDRVGVLSVTILFSSMHCYEFTLCYLRAFFLLFVVEFVFDGVFNQHSQLIFINVSVENEKNKL